jgi:hypothetical protein
MHSHVFGKVRFPAIRHARGIIATAFWRQITSLALRQRHYASVVFQPLRRAFLNSSLSLSYIAQAPVLPYQSIKAYQQTNLTSNSSHPHQSKQSTPIPTATMFRVAATASRTARTNARFFSSVHLLHTNPSLTLLRSDQRSWCFSLAFKLPS